MVKALLVWLVTFAVSAALARGAAWQWAFQMTIPFPSYDNEAIYLRIKDRVFTRGWLLAAVISSSLVGGAMLVDDVSMLLMCVSGSILIVAVTASRGYKLFRLALDELMLPWPPIQRDE